MVDLIEKAFVDNPTDEVLAIFLDLSKAFDTIDHKILFKKLFHYDIDGVPLGWFKSYSSSRKQFISFDDTNSSLLDILVGVPQGSIYWVL